MRSKARRLRADSGVGLVIVDYLQLMQGPSNSESRQQEVSQISRGLKALAKELGIPVIALSQLSRAPEQRTGDNKRPQLSDLRESGAIEQDADLIMFLYRQEFYEGEAEDTAEVLRLDGIATVPYGSFEDVLVTEDRNPLEPGFVENKFYAPGVGVVFERMVQGGEGELQLKSVDTIEPPRFASIEEAVAFLEGKVDVPVVLPSNLPRDAHLAYDPELWRVRGQRGATLRLDFGLESSLTISYGFSGFDGCGGDLSRPVDVLGQRGLIVEHESGGANLIWPVPSGSFEGRYGLDSHELSGERLIRMAWSMERARVEANREAFPGC